MTSPIYLVTACTLIVAITFAHSYLGEKYILRRLFRLALPTLFGSDAFTKQTLRFAWHLTSIAWLGMAVLLFYSADARITKLISVIFLISAPFPLVATRGKHLSWLVFIAIGVLCWLHSLQLVN